MSQDKKQVWDAMTSVERDGIEMIVRDPDMAWVMWSLCAKSAAKAAQQLSQVAPGAQVVLRMHSRQAREGSGPALLHTLDVPVSSWVGGRLVPLGLPGAWHTCSLGVRVGDPEDQEGYFVSILSSEPVLSPHRTPGQGELVWKELA